VAEVKSANKILLVEDEFNIAKLFSYNLTKAGYQCEVASNGREGYEKALTYHPDLIISDVMMPEVDGYEFRKKLLENEELRKIPFVFLTAKGEEEDILQGYDLEIEDYILKTSSPKVVLAKVSAILKTLEKERSKVVDEVSKAADSMGVKVVPEEFPKFEGFEIKHWHQPHKNVPGGDFIDYIKIDETIWLLFLAIRWENDGELGILLLHTLVTFEAQLALCLKHPQITNQALFFKK